MRKAVALKFSGYFAFTLELASYRIRSVIHKSKGSRVLTQTLSSPCRAAPIPGVPTLPAPVPVPGREASPQDCPSELDLHPALEHSSYAQLRYALLLVNN